MTPDMMHQQMPTQGGWDPSAFTPMIAPGSQYDMGYSLGAAGMGGIMQQPSPPIPQPPPMNNNIFDLPIRFVFPQQ